MSPEPLLEARKIVKSFGRVQALTGANFTVYPQEVVALVGDNGAGKSTLVKTLVGVHPPDSGEILFEGKPVHITTPQHAREIGIETVYQDLALAAEIDPAANMFLGREILRGGPLGKLGFLDKAAMRRKSDEAFRELGVRIQDTSARVANMSGGQRQGIAITRAVTWASKVVFMDEPTAALGVVQTRNVLDQIKRVRDQGLAVVLISHIQGPQEFDAAQQTPIVNAVAAKKPDAVLIAPTDTKALYAPIKQMADAGTKIVLVDTTLDQPDMAVSQIASDNEAGGETAAKALADLIGGKGKVFVVNVKPGISTTDAREKGFVAGAKAAGLDYVGREYSNDKPEEAAAKTKAALQKHPDLAGIFGTNLFSAEGAASGVREAGAKVKIVGFDAGPKQVKDLEDGTVQALIAQKPADIGAQGVEQAYNALTGKPTTKKIGTESTTITKDNLADSQDALYKPSC